MKKMIFSRKAILAFLIGATAVLAQHRGFTQVQADSLLHDAGLAEVITYTLAHQPAIHQAAIDEEITALQIRSRLSTWYPQVNFNYLYQHNFRVATSIIGGNPVRLGVSNTSALQFAVSQNLFDRDVLLANRTKSTVLQQSRQESEETRIAYVASVSKSFYDVLTTRQQLRVNATNILRLQRSLRDAKDRYDAGIVDKTDYKRATIALNNALAAQKSTEALLVARQEYLKSLMNYPEAAELPLRYDSLSLEKEMELDTLQVPDFSQRIEYRMLETQKKLQMSGLQYYKWAFIPALSANGAYNLNYLNNSFSKLYQSSFPASFAGLTLSFPIFQGGKRRFNVLQAQWELKRTDEALAGLRNSLNSQYQTALAGYKSSLAAYQAVKENVVLAREVYEVINLQYRAGVKSYLEVITAETDLRTAEINYYNALYSVLSSKVDVQRSLGTLKY